MAKQNAYSPIEIRTKERGESSEADRREDNNKENKNNDHVSREYFKIIEPVFSLFFLLNIAL